MVENKNTQNEKIHYEKILELQIALLSVKQILVGQKIS
jgi:hypothetical protein